MSKRIDGIATRKRILSAACQVFSEKGYRDATFGEICQQAEVNIASINYHFRDKESLYVEVWQHAAEEARRLHPVDDGVAEDAPAEQRLRGFVRSLLKRMTDRGRLGYLQRLRLMEMARPTGIIDRLQWQVLKPYRELLLEVIRDLLGPNTTPRDMDYCELVIVGPCLMAGLGISSRMLKGCPTLAKQDVEPFAEYMVSLLLDGIHSLRRRLDAKTVLAVKD